MPDEGFLDFEPPPADDAWQPQSDGEADWAVMKIKAAQAKVAAKQDERARAMEKWDRYVEQETRHALHECAFFEGKLHGYLLRLQEAGKLGKKKSHDLPNGRLQLRHVDAKYEVQDKDALLAFAEAREVLRVKIEPDMGAIREMCATGEEVPGMVLVRQAGDVFAVILPKAEKVSEV